MSVTQLIVGFIRGKKKKSASQTKHDTTSGVLLKMEVGISKGPWRRA